MTVSTITGIPADVKRALENNNRSSNTTNSIEKAPSQASLPKDIINTADLAPALDVPAAIAQTQVQNREAARSTLSDADFEVLDQQASAQQQVAAQPARSVAAQATKLPADLLQLINE